MKISLFDNSSQMIGCEVLEFDEGHPGVVIRKFGEDRS